MDLYNTLARKKETFPDPILQKTITMYSCGPTVYDETHIGHMRKFTMDDILKRSLVYLGYDVKHAMNITDVGHLTGDDDTGEDKLEKGAKKSGKTVWDVAKYYEDAFWKTLKSLNIDKSDIKVLIATQNIKSMITLIKKLEKNDYAYSTDEAVYFDVMKFSNYGKLSGQKLEDKISGARGEVNTDSQKKHPADFALWLKRVGRFSNHTMHWESPWGDGFPGWHIECSAMSMDGLKTETIDIHTGGVDHIPVHHENEIAQSEAATGKKFVKWWVHHAFLQVNGEKMSKSKGNFYTLSDVIKKGIDPLTLRYLFLQTHYRKFMNFTWVAAEAAQTAYFSLKEIYTKLEESSRAAQITKLDDLSGAALFYHKTFRSELSNDLNTASLLGNIWHMLKQVDLTDKEKVFLLEDINKVLGLDLGKNEVVEKIPDEIIELAEKRKLARSNNDFKTSDEIRIEIEKRGYTIHDTSGGFKLQREHQQPPSPSPKQ